MSLTPEQTALLAAPLDRDHVSTREQGGKTLSYVEAWHAIAEANRIFGFDAWDRETVLLTETNRELVELQGKSGPYKQWRVGYLAKVRIKVGDTIREGTGFGSGMSKPEALGDAIESAAKEAESDAMKRALMTFGNPFGLALYDKSHANVAAAPPPPPPEETGLYIACKSAIDMAAEQNGKAGLDAWAADNKVSMGRIQQESPTIYAAVRRYYAGKLEACKPTPQQQPAAEDFGLQGDQIPEFA